MNNILIGAVLGLVQGISEWLPISSKTQVGIASIALLHLTFSQAYTFGLFMEIGTILAAIIYFRREIYSLIRVLVLRGNHEEKRLFTYVLITTIVTGAIGAVLYLYVDSISGGIPLGIPMVIIGLILIADSLVIWHSRTKQRYGKNTRKFKDLTIRDYLLVGIVQGIAALPGVSRSGITTSAMLLMNIEPDEAFRLSFLVGIFAAGGAFALTLLASHTNVSSALSSIGLAGLAAAIIVAIIVSLFLIDFLIKIAGKSKIVYLTAALGILAIASGVVALVIGLPVGLGS
ncbi:MAG: undecaprenyl-diphosphate phosphatase [Candidatus Micrarchaeota archaeon]|nr:undecaprenyl-diphosphate phosphatase [Candidatus Micrarchaeota archaeon]